MIRHGPLLATASSACQGADISSLDSPLEGDGFEPSVPRSPVSSVGAACRSCLRGSGSGSARFLLLGGPFHRAGLPYGLGGLRFAALLGRFFFPAVRFIYTLALYRLDQQFAERPDQGGRLLHFRERYDMRRMRPAASAARFGAAWRTGM